MHVSHIFSSPDVSILRVAPTFTVILLSSGIAVGQDCPCSSNDCTEANQVYTDVTNLANELEGSTADANKLAELEHATKQALQLWAKESSVTNSRAAARMGILQESFEDWVSAARSYDLALRVNSERGNVCPLDDERRKTVEAARKRIGPRRMAVAIDVDPPSAQIKARRQLPASKVEWQYSPQPIPNSAGEFWLNPGPQVLLAEAPGCQPVTVRYDADRENPGSVVMRLSCSSPIPPGLPKQANQSGQQPMPSRHPLQPGGLSKGSVRPIGSATIHTSDAWQPLFHSELDWLVASAALASVGIGTWFAIDQFHDYHTMNNQLKEMCPANNECASQDEPDAYHALQSKARAARNQSVVAAAGAGAAALATGLYFRWRWHQNREPYNGNAGDLHWQIAASAEKGGARAAISAEW